ncbi:MAG: hypothetical protein EON60_04075 [Alphaproteobacteria bacterium]|nr:MAG: hypothetical protein EON60_04075 [Alphaproteobacteria bacterium]
MLPLVLLSTALLPCAVPWAQIQTAPKARGMLPLPVMPQDDVLAATLENIYLNREDIDQALVVVEVGQREENPQWIMSPTQMQVMLDTLLQFMPEKPTVEDAIWPKLKRKDPNYKGMRVVLRTVWGRYFEPFTIFEGQVKAANGRLMVPDYGRRLEYWMFGASRVRRDQMMGANLLHVLTFEQCRLLGQQIVETRPRQCLLPDNNLLLETQELPTMASARIRDFDGCLKHGKALIYTFPRRCISAGGRVFTEPPKVYEAPQPADAPMVSGTAVVPQVNVMTGGGVSLKSELIPASNVAPVPAQ